MLIRVYRLHIPRNEDTFALRHALWLHYKCNFLVFFLIHRYLIFDLIHFIGEKPSLREELVIVWVLLLHLFEVSCQVILPRYLKHSWKVIDSLVRFDSLK